MKYLSTVHTKTAHFCSLQLTSYFFCLQEIYIFSFLHITSLLNKPHFKSPVQKSRLQKGLYKIDNYPFKGMEPLQCSALLLDKKTLTKRQVVC